MAPWAFTNAVGSTKSMKPPRTRNGASGLRRGCCDANEGSETVAEIRVSLPTFPHLRTGAAGSGGVSAIHLSDQVERRQIERTHVSFTPARFGHSVASSVIRSESRSMPPHAPGSTAVVPSVSMPIAVHVGSRRQEEQRSWVRQYGRGSGSTHGPRSSGNGEATYSYR